MTQLDDLTAAVKALSDDQTLVLAQVLAEILALLKALQPKGTVQEDRV